jgi:predicted nuclease of predicted toxin-antitoxin system
MKILANENLPASFIHALRAKGHDVLSAKESMRSEADMVLLARAQSEGRVVVTQDKDFGELAFRHRLPAACGVVLFRLSGDDPDADISRMIAVVDSRPNWSGLFAVATNDRVRVRPLPKAGSP